MFSKGLREILRAAATAKPGRHDKNLIISVAYAFYISRALGLVFRQAAGAAWVS